MVSKIGPAKLPPSLPAKFHEMSPHDKVRALQAYILEFLETRDHTTPGELNQALPDVTPDSIRRQLRALAAEQSIFEGFIGNVPVYRKNGILAHPSLQKFMDAGRQSFSFRTYHDRANGGDAITITEYHVSPLGTRRATNGIRVPVEHLANFVQMLNEIATMIRKQPEKLEGNLRPDNK